MCVVHVYSLLLCLLIYYKITLTDGFTLPFTSLSSQVLPRRPTNSTVAPVKNLPSVSTFNSGSHHLESFASHSKPKGFDNGISADVIPDSVGSETTVFSTSHLPHLASVSSSNDLPFSTRDYFLYNTDLSSGILSTNAFNVAPSSVDNSYVSPATRSFDNGLTPTKCNFDSPITSLPSNNLNIIPSSTSVLNIANPNILQVSREPSVEARVSSQTNSQYFLNTVTTLDSVSNISPTYLHAVSIDAPVIRNEPKPPSSSIDCCKVPPVTNTLTESTFPSIAQASVTDNLIKIKPQSFTIRQDFPTTVLQPNTLHYAALSSGSACPKDKPLPVPASNKNEPQPSISAQDSCPAINQNSGNTQSFIPEKKSNGIFLPFTADNSLLTVSSKPNNVNQNVASLHANEMACYRNELLSNVGLNTDSRVPSVLPTINFNSAKAGDSVSNLDQFPIMNAKFGLPGQTDRNEFLLDPRISPPVTSNSINLPFSVKDSILQANINSLGSTNQIIFDQRCSPPMDTVTSTLASSSYEFIPQNALSYLNMTPTVQNVNVPFEFVNKFAPSSFVRPSYSMNYLNADPTIDIKSSQLPSFLQDCKSTSSVPGDSSPTNLPSVSLTGSRRFTVKPETLDSKNTPVVPLQIDGKPLQGLATPLKNNKMTPNACLTPRSFVDLSSTTNVNCPSLHVSAPTLSPSPNILHVQQCPVNINSNCKVPTISDVKTLPFNSEKEPLNNVEFNRQLAPADGLCYGVPPLSQMLNNLNLPPQLGLVSTTGLNQLSFKSPCLLNSSQIIQSNYLGSSPFSTINSQTTPIFPVSPIISNENLAVTSGSNIQIASLPKTTIDLLSQQPISLPKYSSLPVNVEVTNQKPSPLSILCSGMVTPSPPSLPPNVNVLSFNCPQYSSSPINIFLPTTIPSPLKESISCPTVEKLAIPSERPVDLHCLNTANKISPSTTNCSCNVALQSLTPICDHEKSLESFPSTTYLMAPVTAPTVASNSLLSQTNMQHVQNPQVNILPSVTVAPVTTPTVATNSLQSQTNMQYVQNPQIKDLPSVTVSSPESIKSVPLASNKMTKIQSTGSACPNILTSPLTSISNNLPLNDLSCMLQKPFLKMSPILDAHEIDINRCGVNINNLPMCTLNTCPFPPQILNPSEAINLVNGLTPTYIDIPMLSAPRNELPLVPATQCCKSIPFAEVLAPIVPEQLNKFCSPVLPLCGVDLSSIYSTDANPQWPIITPFPTSSSIKTICNEEKSCIPKSNTPCSLPTSSLVPYCQPLEPISEILIPFDVCPSKALYEPVLIPESTLPIFNALPNTDATMPSFYPPSLSKEPEIQYCLVDIPISASANVEPYNQLSILDTSYSSPFLQLQPCTLPCRPPIASADNMYPMQEIVMPWLDPSCQGNVLVDLLYPNTDMFYPNNVPVILNDLPSVVPSYINEPVVNPVSEFYILDDSVLCPFNSPDLVSNSFSSISTLPNVYFTESVTPVSNIDYQHSLSSSPIMVSPNSVSDLATQLTSTFLSSALSNLTALYLEPNCPSIEHIPTVSVPKKKGCNRKSWLPSRKSKKGKYFSDTMYASASDPIPTFSESPSDNAIDVSESLSTNCTSDTNTDFYKSYTSDE